MLKDQLNYDIIVCVCVQSNNCMIICNMYSTVCMLGTLIYWPWYLEHLYRQGCNCHCQSGWDTTVNITCTHTS